MNFTRSIVVALLLIPLNSFASSSTSSPDSSAAGTSKWTYNPNYEVTRPGSFRIGVLGGGSLMTGENMSSKSGVSSAIMAGFGKGTFSVEAGAMYLMLPAVGSLEIAPEMTEQVSLTNEYVGVPVWAKFNYIEKPLATFFVKAGAIPMFRVSSSEEERTAEDGSKIKIESIDQDVLVVAGIGGTSPLTQSMAFILDISGFYGLSESQAGTRTQGASLNIGLSFDL